MRFNLVCISAALFAAAVSAVPVETVVVRSEECPAPVPAPAPVPTPEVVTPQPQKQEVSPQQCSSNTQLHCCDTVKSTKDSQVSQALSAAGIDHNEASSKGQVGLTCTPITTSVVDALNGNKCSSGVTACCEDNNQVGLVNLNLGCTPITLQNIL